VYFRDGRCPLSRLPRATQDPIVLRTRFLPWTDHAAIGNAVATSSISTYVLLRHFAMRCTVLQIILEHMLVLCL